MNKIALALRALRRIPDFWIETKNTYAQAELILPDNVVFYSGNRWIYTPDDLLVYRIWEHHCRSYYTRWEVGEFMSLARGCRNFLDVGASAGIYSAIFWDCCEVNPIVHSVEPDLRSFDLLKKTKTLNGTKRANGHWNPKNCALAGIDGTWEFCSSGFGAVPGEGVLTKKSVFDGEDEKVQQFLVAVKTLSTYCTETDFVPDLIKMDVESYEYEIILSSREFLSRHRPKLFLELHNEKLAARKKEPGEIVDCLLSAGYKINATRDSRRPFSIPVAHLSFEMPK